MKRTLLQVLTAVVIFAATASCSKPDNGGGRVTPTPTPTPTPSTVSVSGVTLDKTGVTLTVGKTMALTPTISPDNATNKSVTWSSDKPAVATVSGGTVTALSVGEATITVTADGGKTATCKVTVTDKTVPTVSFDSSPKTIVVGGETNIGATVSPNTIKLKYESGNPSVATVDAEGNIKALSPGTTTITVSTEATSDFAATSTTFTLTVTDKPVPTVNFDSSPKTIVIGGEANIGATVSPNTIKLKYVSGNPSVATVDAAGNIKALSPGTTTITVSTEATPEYDAVSRSFFITVVEKTTPAITIAHAGTIEVGKTENLDASVYPEDLVLRYGTWDSSILSVDDKGNITGVCPGTTLVRVYTEETPGCWSGGAFKYITVIQPVTGVTINPGSISVIQQRGCQVVAEISPSNASNRGIRWSSSDESIATVDGSGNVWAVSPGTVIITATTEDGGYTADCVVTVEKMRPVTGIALNCDDMALGTATWQQLFATVYPFDATNKNVIWSTGDENIATVRRMDEIFIQAENPGTTVITATTEDGGYVASCTVTVYSGSSGECFPYEDTNITMIQGWDYSLRFIYDRPKSFVEKLSSSNESVATIDNNLVIHAISPGTAVITVTLYSGSIATFCVTVAKDLEGGIESFVEKNTERWF